MFSIDADKNLLNKFKEASKFYKLGEFEQAINCYEQIIEIDPLNEYAYLNKGAILIILDKYKEAVLCLDQAINAIPNISNHIIYKLVKKAF